MSLRRLVFAIAISLLVAVTGRATINVALQMQSGNPSSATSDPNNHGHYLIQRAQYAMDYNDGTRQPNWVAWDLTAADVGSSGRSNFIQDTTLPAGFYQVLTTDYSGSGYDRGHMCPSADRTVTTADNQVVFYMSNMVPQAPDNNQGVWGNFEAYCRTLASAGNELLIMCGPSGFAGSTIASGVAIPGYTWKIVVVVPPGAGDAVTRITSATRVITIKVPNVSGIRSTPWQTYLTSIAQIENDTGLTFLTAVDPSIRTALRSVVDGQPAAGAPTITNQPSTQTTFTGGTATFAVTATGDAPLAYQWRKDSLALSGATDATLTIANAQASDAGSYDVVVTNAVGSVTSAAAALILSNVPPSITSSPSSQTVSAGSNVTFAVTASGSPTLLYQWRKDGGPITGATNVALTLTNVQSANAGNYDVVVTNNSGTATSGAAALTVNPAAPTITTQPSSRTTVTGGSATFLVAAVGTSPLGYQWFRAGTAISGATAATLTLTSVGSADATTYTVVVSNSVGATTSNAATLTVRPAVAYTGGSYAQNFDTLPSASPPTFSFAGSGPFNLDAAQPNGVGASGLVGWSFARTAGSNANALFAVGTGSGTAGSMYSFGASGSGERALGSLLSGANTSTFGVVFINNTNFTINQFTVSYTGEQWRWGGSSTSASRDKLQFEYQLGGNDIVTGTFTPNTGLDFSSVVTSGTAGALNGNTSSAAINGTVSGVAWAPGQTLVLRWREFDVSGSDDGLAVDNFSFSTPIVQPSAPTVTSTSPAPGTTSVGVNSPISVTFNQAVTVGNAWFAITSAASGPVAATVTGGPTTYTLTPPTSFATSDNVTVRILAGQVTEQATGTLKLASDYVFSFTTAASTTPIAPSITTQPAAQTVTAGGTAAFAVVVGGTAPFTYQWRKNGNAIGGNASATTATLTLGAVTPSDAASYDCLVTNSAGSAVSNAAALTVLVPPSIATPPTAQSVLNGGTASFTVSAAGTSPFTFQWRKNGTQLANGGTISGATTATLTITGAGPTDGASYDVVVTNGVGSVTSSAVTLTVSAGQIAYTGGTYTQDFDTLPNNATPAVVLTGAGPHALPSSNPAAVVGWSFAKASGNGTNALFNVGTGSSGTGSIYSFGASGSTDRALGDLLSGTTGSSMGVVLVNNTGGPLTRVTITYTGEQWRYGAGTAAPDKLQFEYRLGGSDIVSGTFTAAPQLDFASLVTTGSARALDGNATSATVTATLTGFVWANGQTLALRWKDFDIVGADDGLAIDNFTFSALPPPAPAVVATAPANGATNVAISAPITVTFDQPVTVSGSWVTITSGTAGPVTATISGGPTSFTFTPTAPWAYNDQISVTLAAAQIVEATTGTVHLASDYSFSFTTVPPTPPSITQAPASQTITAFNGVSFGVTATGTAPLSYQWRKEGNPISGATDATYTLPSAVTADAGNYDVVVTNLAGAATSTPATLTVNKAAATVGLSALNPTYNGAPHAVIAATSPVVLPVVVTYDGSTTAPTNAGSYAVVAMVNDPNYAGGAIATLTIAKASASVTLTNLNQTYDGTQKSAGATTTPGALGVAFTYDNSTTAPTNAGSYAVVGTVTDANYTGSATGTLVVAKAAATVTLAGLNQTFDGTPRTVTATTGPTGLTVQITYDNSPTAPTNAGSYTVVATVNEPNYTGAKSGTLVVNKATGTISFGNLTPTYDGTSKAVTTTTTPAGLAVDVTYDGSASAPTNAGTYAIAGTINDPNYLGSGAATLVIAKAAATVALSDLNQVYAGAARVATVATAPAGLATATTYDGATTAPVNAGSYQVASTVTDPNYIGSAFGTLVVAKASATVTLGNLNPTYDGTAKSVTATTVPAGLTVALTYDSAATSPVNAGSYAVVGTVNSTNYTGSATGTLVIAKASATIALSDLVQAYDGTPRTVTATSTPAGLPMAITYDGVATPPTNPGAYAVTATTTSGNYSASVSDTLLVTITALVRHAPSVSGGLDGSLQVLSGESFTLAGSAWVSGDILVPGTPSLVTNGQPTFGGIVDGSGLASPSNYAVTLSGNAVLRHLVRRANAITLPIVSPPPTATGTRDVTLNRAGDSAGDFATVRDLTLNGNAGSVAVPPGTYRAVVASGNSVLVLGVVGSTTPAVYNVQNLTLNGSARIDVVGPVILTLANGTTVGNGCGAAAHPEWLALRVASGGLTLNAGATFYGAVIAPNGTVTVNGGSALHGSVTADRLTVNGNGELVQIEP